MWVNKRWHTVKYRCCTMTERLQGVVVGCGSRSHSAPVAPAHSRPLRVMAEARSPSLCAQCCEGHEQVTNTVGGVKALQQG